MVNSGLFSDFERIAALPPGEAREGRSGHPHLGVRPPPRGPGIASQGSGRAFPGRTRRPARSAPVAAVSPRAIQCVSRAGCRHNR